jgi:hypothetical protein
VYTHYRETCWYGRGYGSIKTLLLLVYGIHFSLSMCPDVYVLLYPNHLTTLDAKLTYHYKRPIIILVPSLNTQLQLPRHFLLIYRRHVLDGKQHRNPRPRSTVEISIAKHVHSGDVFGS